MADPGRWTELVAGDDFAGYRIERGLGRGGMGILYLATEPGLDRRVALKLIAPEAAEEAVFARRFAEESRIAASIEHPNVVPIYAAGEEDGVPYIAMRYVAGSDLGARLAAVGSLEPAAAVALIAQVANGLDAIHAAGLVHRDVKPANVLLSGDPGHEHAYITDFGVARNVATQSGLTQTGRFVGTLDYVAPEQISGGAIDARVDVYALGCLLYKLLTGQVPYPREGEAARLYAHLHDPPPSPSLYEPSLPMALDDVVVRALSKQPGDRYPSAGDLGRAAVAALGGGAVAIPERTVATGAAATVEPKAPPPVAAAGTVESAATAASRTSADAAASTGSAGAPPTTSTRRLDPDPGGPRRGSKRPRLYLLGGALAMIAVIVVAIVLASGGGGGGDGTIASEGTQATPIETKEETGKQPEEKKEQKPQPQRLTANELIAQGDAICTKAREAFKTTRAKFPEAKTEELLSVPYSEELVANSSRAVSELQALVPPKEKQAAFETYLASYEEVNGWDRDALAAARAGDGTAYEIAREDRNETEDNRTRMAEEVGFHVCSGSKA